MTRILSVGYEKNALAEECDNNGGSPVIQSTTAHSGTYAVEYTSLVSATRKGCIHQFTGSVQNGPYWVEAYLYVKAYPSAQNRIMAFLAGGNLTSTAAAWITLDNTGVLRLFTDNAQVGGSSSALSLNTWYRIGIHVDRTAAGGSQTCEGSLATGEGTATIWATSSAATFTNQFVSVMVGANLNAEAQTTGDWIYDDIRINDSTLSNQTSWPGPEKLLYRWPNAAGDLNAWTGGGADDHTGGGATPANNWQNEGTTNDKPTADDNNYVSSNTLNQVDTYNLESVFGTLTTSDTVNAVHAVIRAGGSAASANATARPRIYASQGGSSTTAGAGLSPANTSYVSGSTVTRAPSLTIYTVPGSGAALTPGNVQSMLLGLILSATNTNAVRVSTVYMIIAYTPATFVATGNRLLMGM